MFSFEIILTSYMLFSGLNGGARQIMDKLLCPLSVHCCWIKYLGDVH